jgi:GxxExxY protein
MPITHTFAFQRLSQKDFGDIAFAVMDHVFAIHTEFGRFFDERIYKQELAARMAGVSLEVPITVGLGAFSKVYHLDAVVGSGGLFEFKCADEIHPRHRGQTLNYLLLADLEHARLVNVRPEKVQHEFVNRTHRLVDLRSPRVTDLNWNSTTPGAAKIRDLVMAMLSDWGTGLELPLYEEALTFFLGGVDIVDVAVPVSGSSGILGDQRMRLAMPDTAFKLTALSDNNETFPQHAQRLLAHTPLKAIHWINIACQHVTFTTIR